MNKYESFRLGILKKAAPLSDYGSELYASTYGLSAEFGIPEPHVREQLLGLAKNGLIALATCDGQLERHYKEWQDKDSFFFDGGSVRIRVLSAGGELLSSLPKTPIGFAATSK